MTISLSIEPDGRIAHVRLSNPAGANAVNLTFATTFAEVISEIERKAPRVVVLSAEGKVFCAGGDLGAFNTAGQNLPHLMQEIVGKTHDALLRLEKLKIPVVAAVEGTAGGIGLSLILAADIVIAGPNAQFVAGYTAVGLTPDGGMTRRLPSLIGARRAADMMLRNARISAETAAAWGLVSSVCAQEEVFETALQISRQLANGPKEAISRAVELLRAGQDMDLAEALAAEEEAIVSMCRSKDAKEGIAAFVERRSPSFS